MNWSKILPWIIFALVLVLLWLVFTRTSGYDSVNPRQAIWSTGQAIQGPPLEVISGVTANVPFANMPQPAAGAPNYTMSMDMNVAQAAPVWRFIMENLGPSPPNQTPSSPARQPWINVQPGNALNLEVGHVASAGADQVLVPVSTGYGTFFNLTFTVSPTAFTAYVNGTQVAQYTYTASEGAPTWPPPPPSWHWGNGANAGAQGSNAPGNTFGSIMVRNAYFFPTVLTQAQITTLGQVNWVPTSTPTTGNILQDNSFEGFLPAINSSAANVPGQFAYISTPPPGSPWSVTGAMAAGMTSNPMWGGAPAQDGQVYAILQSAASIQQTVTVIPGTVYTISWSERGRPPVSTYSSGNDINVSINGTSIYTETNIIDTGSWVAKTATWPAPAGITSAILRFYTTINTAAGPSTFIDNVAMVATTPAPAATPPATTGTGTTPPATTGTGTTPPATTGTMPPATTPPMGSSTVGSGVAATPLAGSTPIASSLGAPLSTLPMSSPNGVQPTPLSLAPGAYNAPNLYVLSYGYIPH